MTETDATPREPEEDRYRHELRRGAWVNAMGLVAKLFHPIFMVGLTWAFDPVLMGTYFTGVFISEIALSLVGSGFADAATIYGSHHADDEDDAEAGARLYGLLGNVFTITVLGSAAVIALAYLGASALVDAYYAEYEGLAPALVLLAWSVPFSVISQIAIATTRARFRMEYDAVIAGFVTPVLLLGLSMVAWWLDAGLVGLMIAHLATRIVVAGLSVWGMSRHFDVRRIVAAALRPRIDRRILAFALPQNLNLTFNRYNTKLDGIMLGALGFAPALVAFYATASLVTTNIRQIKLVFSSSLAPIVARHHAAGQTRAFEAVLGRISRWTTTLAAMVLLVMVVLRDDIMLLFDEAYRGDTTFFLVLLVPPLLSCAVGMAGNCITWCGHSRWTLLNSSLIAGINTVLNLVMIPRWGLVGAATATAIASTAISALQLAELRALEGVRMRWGDLGMPLVVFAGLVVGTWALVGDPATVGTVAVRIGLSVGLVLAYVGILAATGHPEIRGLLRRPVPG